jgi:pyruvate dehydrogenase E1 component alpha subunit
MHLLATDVGILGTVPLVAATIPMAVGSGLAAKMRGDGRVAVAFFGDGATEEGHFHESVNLAAVYRLPVLFVCENNQYASHMPLLERRVKDNIVAAADAHGIAGMRLDGNDVLAVYNAAVHAVARAREGGGPTLLECDTYRWRGHVGPSYDMDVGVKRHDELAAWKPKDPILRLNRILADAGVPQADMDRMARDVEADVDQAVAFAMDAPPPEPSALFEHVFVEERSCAR